MQISEMNVEYVDHMGSDLNVVNAARVSFARIATEFTDKDAKLINYLAKHNHWTPFAHTSISLRIKAPIFVARQAVKHQVGLVWNEVSRRYVDDEPEFWFPKEFRVKPENAKQGSGGAMEESSMWLSAATEHVKNLDSFYNSAIACGMAPEQARMFLPLNSMTEWIWTGSLAAFCRVCKLRLDPHAQLEIQELVGGIKRVVEPLFPVSFQAIMEN